MCLAAGQRLMFGLGGANRRFEGGFFAIEQGGRKRERVEFDRSCLGWLLAAGGRGRAGGELG